MSAYHKSFPLKPLYPECRRPSKPWFTKGLFVSCNRKNFLYKQFQTDPLHIATKFNNFFANMGPSLASKVPSTQFSHKDFLVGHYANCFFLNPTTPSEVSSIVHSLKTSKCEGVDGLSLSPIKETIDLLAAPLSHIFNLSFERGVFPDKLKLAKILPVFISDDPFLFSNYRPISILPCLSKVLEKVFYLRLSEFLTKFNILNHHQYGDN